jgi:hypothetical protein
MKKPTTFTPVMKQTAKNPSQVQDLKKTIRERAAIQIEQALREIKRGVFVF